MARYIDADALKADYLVPSTSTKTVSTQYVSLFQILNAPIADVTETKHGEWTEKEVIHAEEAKTVIEEWQSCRCSVCGRYDTRPYMYYFDNPNYCSWCGAKMVKGESDGRSNKQKRIISRI